MWLRIEEASTQNKDLRAQISNLNMQVAQVVALLGRNEPRPKNKDSQAKAVTVIEKTEGAGGGVDSALIGNPGNVAGSKTTGHIWHSHAGRKRSGQKNGFTRVSDLQCHDS